MKINNELETTKSGVGNELENLASLVIDAWLDKIASNQPTMCAYFVGLIKEDIYEPARICLSKI